MKVLMSTVHFISAALLGAGVVLQTAPATAQEGPLKSFKNDLFSHQRVLETSDGGAFKIIDYNEMRDINGRDEEPERRVKGAYVDTSVRRFQENETLELGGRMVDVARVGQATAQRFSVIFVHGRGGDRRLGVNDYTFGGNFNRLKNLVVRNDGTYYAVSVRSFDASGSQDVAALVRHASQQSAGRPVILACASMGGIVCQHVARDPDTVRSLSGMVLLGGPPDAGLPATPFIKQGLPIYFSHGSADSVYRAQDQIDLYQRLQKAGHPVQFTLFQTGGHGTPIRMVDWREVINFLLFTHR